ncbi:MAG: hypothetical protein E7035_08305 [Verrucomicrobiaceae bacterium]|nr:hypothetical protein [Verrucomicrobiaceae bacterium]
MRKTICTCFCALLMSVAFGADKIKVACVGDSITYGATIKNRKEHSYPAQLSKILGSKYEVVNFGISGRTVLSKADYPYLKTGQFKQALAFNPNIVLIKLGTNDTKSYNIKHVADFENDYDTLVNAFKNLSSNPKIYICIPIDTFAKGSGINSDRLQNVIIPLIKKVAKKHSLEIIDLFYTFKKQRKYLPDAVHPNEEGAKLLAEKIAKEIQK